MYKRLMYMICMTKMHFIFFFLFVGHNIRRRELFEKEVLGSFDKGKHASSSEKDCLNNNLEKHEKKVLERDCDANTVVNRDEVILGENDTVCTDILLKSKTVLTDDPKKCISAPDSRAGYSSEKTIIVPLSSDTLPSVDDSLSKVL